MTPAIATGFSRSQINRSSAREACVRPRRAWSVRSPSRARRTTISGPGQAVAGRTRAVADRARAWCSSWRRPTFDSGRIPRPSGGPGRERAMGPRGRTPDHRARDSGAARRAPPPGSRRLPRRLARYLLDVSVGPGQRRDPVAAATSRATPTDAQQVGTVRLDLDVQDDVVQAERGLHVHPGARDRRRSAPGCPRGRAAMLSSLGEHSMPFEHDAAELARAASGSARAGTRVPGPAQRHEIARPRCSGRPHTRPLARRRRRRPGRRRACRSPGDRAPPGPARRPRLRAHPMAAGSPRPCTPCVA